MSLFLQVGYESYKLHKRSSTFVCLHVTRVRSSAREWKEKKTAGEINVFITEISVKAGTQYREYNVKKFIKGRGGKLNPPRRTWSAEIS